MVTLVVYSCNLKLIMTKYTIRRSRRAKNLLLHVDMAGEVELVMPWHVSFREGEKFVVEQAEWLERTRRTKARQRLAVPKRRLVTGEKIPVFGEWYELEVGCEQSRRRARFREEGQVVVVRASDRQQVRSALTKWYRKKAYTYFRRVVDDYCVRVGVAVDKVVVSDARSQWGSCMNESRRVSLQWRLALAPVPVANYVVAHEVAHLRERRHTPAFWRQVQLLDGEFEVHRVWLKRYGYTLVL